MRKLNLKEEIFIDQSDKNVCGFIGTASTTQAAKYQFRVSK